MKRKNSKSDVNKTDDSSKKMNTRKIICFVTFAAAIGILTTSKILSRKLISSYKQPSTNTQRTEDMLSTFKNNDPNKSNETECRNRTVYEFPKDAMTDSNYKLDAFGIIVHVLIIAYLLSAIAIVCDEYFVHSLNRISKDLKLKEDVAGATFMAAGSSAPELFTSLVGVIIAKSDVGTGTIVGSAVFNVLFIIAICALAAKSTLYIDWYPLTRDSIYYIVAVAALLGVLEDGKVTWYESAILVGLYVFYILIMYFNERIQKFAKSKIKFDHNSYDFLETVTLIDPEKVSIGITRPRSVMTDDDDDDDDEPVNPFQMPTKKFMKVVHVILFPISLLFFLTVPDSRRPFFRKFPLYFLSFIMSTVYLGVLTYLLVWMVVVVAYTLDIPDTVAGLTILAAGTSVPEVVSGIIVTRKGKGEMAISNSLGSNVFDILICLGMPWLLENILSGESVVIFSKGIFYSTAILLSTVFILILSFVVNRWRLNKKLGILMLVLWTIVTVITCLFEYNVFGDFSIPIC